MGRRKANRPDLALPKVGPRVNPRGLAKRVRQTPLFQALQAGAGPNVEFTDEAVIGMGVELDADEKEVIKEVPAKVDGVEVGIAQIYNDGSVGIVLNKDAPADKIAKLGGIAGEYGYSIGDFIDGAP
jgi:hypothetical protein